MNRKDIKRNTSIKNSMSFSYSRNFYPSSLDTSHMFFVKKSHKIMTALYMVTELIPEKETLRLESRARSTELLACLFEGLSMPVSDRAKSISKSQSLLEQVLCLLETLHVVGYISDMNAKILIIESQKLQDKLSTYLSQTINSQKKFAPNASGKDFTFSDGFFGSDDMSVIQKTDPERIFGNSVDEDISGKISVKKTNFEKTEKNIKDIKDTPKRTSNKGQSNDLKKQTKGQLVSKKDIRQEQIINVLKKKKKSSIVSICEECPGYASKTIQRDLNELIDSGLVVREGERRWAVYSLFIG